MPPKDLHTLLIEKLIPGGFGLGRLAEGIVVLVRYVLPGEKVLVRETDRKRDYIGAELVQVLSPAPDRTDPPCPVYGRCGGCDLQHTGPETQIRLKKAILVDSLQRAAGNSIPAPALALEEPLAAPVQFGYRQRLRLQVDRAGNYGFFRPESHVLEPVSQCMLAGDELNKVLRQLQTSALFPGLLAHCHAFELLYNPAENNSVLLLHFRRKPRPADSLCARDLTNETRGLGAVLMQVEGYGLYDPRQQAFLASPPLLSHNMTLAMAASDFTFSWEVGGFCQVNLGQNRTLVELVLEMTAGGPHDRILDLYCGYGNFSLPLAKLAQEVLGIDVQNGAIRSAKRNAGRNNIPNCCFEKQQVPAAVNTLVETGRTFATIILDPPRQGAPETVPLLPKLGADQIIYVSCNPATLARDLAALIPGGYQLSRLVPVDMFPQTHHLESVALLKRSGL